MWAEQGKSLQSLRTQTKRRCGATGADAKTMDSLRETVEALNIESAEQKNKGHGPLREAL